MHVSARQSTAARRRSSRRLARHHAAPSTRSSTHTMNRSLSRILPAVSAATLRPVRHAGIRAVWQPVLTHHAQTQPTRIRSSRAFATTTVPPSSSSSSNDSSSPPPPPPPSPGIAGKLKDLMTKYGRHALAVYLALSAVDLGLTFLCVHLVGADKIEWVKDYAVAQWRVARYGADQAREMRALEVEEQRLKDAEDAAGGKVAEGGKKKKGNAILWAEFALAYGIHKTLLLPVRVGATAAVTPRLVHWLTARGWVGKVRPKCTTWTSHSTDHHYRGVSNVRQHTHPEKSSRRRKRLRIGSRRPRTASRRLPSGQRTSSGRCMHDRQVTPGQTT